MSVQAKARGSGVELKPSNFADAHRRHKKMVEASRAKLARSNERVLERLKQEEFRNLQKAGRLHSPKGVLRVERYKNEKLWPVYSHAAVKPIPKSLRREVLDRDPVCVWCKRGKSEVAGWVVPAVRGGKGVAENLVGSCNRCNMLKANFMPKEVGWRLKISLPASRILEVAAVGAGETRATLLGQQSPSKKVIFYLRQKHKNHMRLVLDEDRVCVWCREARANTIDHIIPISRGGSNNSLNLVGSCFKCNVKKSNWLPKEIGWVLRIPKRFFGRSPVLGVRVEADVIGLRVVEPREPKGKLRSKLVEEANYSLADHRIGKEILKMDVWCCWCRGAEAKRVNRIIPKALGGGKTGTNLVGSCVKCAEERKDKLPCELGWVLRMPLRLVLQYH